MVTLEELKKDEEVECFIKNAQRQLDALGYTEHSHRHLNLVSKRAATILRTLGHDEHSVELAKIAGYLHDIGNAVNRVDHAHSGAILSYEILKKFDIPTEDRIEIMMAIGNHDEATGNVVSDISAALILADKSDVHKTRVSKTNISLFNKHDKVNYAVTDSELILNKESRKVTLKLKIDTKVCPVLKYFEIFMDRTMMSKNAAQYLGLWFELNINDTNLL